jgi:hypothetical protein
VQHAHISKYETSFYMFRVCTQRLRDRLLLNNSHHVLTPKNGNMHAMQRANENNMSEGKTKFPLGEAPFLLYDSLA